MKKTITISTIALVIGAIISPVVGMAIGETRNVILGLAPDEAVLQLADRIDTSRIESETKMQEMQRTIDSQNNKIAAQEQQLVTQGDKIDNAKSQIATVSETVVKQRDCSDDINKYCYTSSFKDPEEFKNFLKAYEKMDNYSDYKDKFAKEFDACQKALACK
jgi:hypothetical protein